MLKPQRNPRTALFTIHEILTTTVSVAKRGTVDLASKVCDAIFLSACMLLIYPTALATYEPRVKAKADQLASHIQKNIDQPIDASAWSMFLSFDIMGAVGFGKEFNNLETGVEHPAIKGVHDHMAILGTLGHVPWFLNLASRIPGAASGYSSFFKWCEDEIERKQKVQSSSEFVDLDIILTDIGLECGRNSTGCRLLAPQGVR